MRIVRSPNNLACLFLYLFGLPASLLEQTARHRLLLMLLVALVVLVEQVNQQTQVDEYHDENKKHQKQSDVNVGVYNVEDELDERRADSLQLRFDVVSLQNLQTMLHNCFFQRHLVES
jgi:hypothetical protein